MEITWAPWRVEYILAPKSDACVFCPMQSPGNDRQQLILWRGQSSFCVLNRFPYNPGHLMIAPYAHTEDLAGVGSAVQQELIWAMGEAMQILRSTLKADGLNCGLNLGQTAGAGVLGHLHFHVVPRWNGDTNFLPVLAQTRSMPEYLDETYAKLAPAFANLNRGG